VHYKYRTGQDKTRQDKCMYTGLDWKRERERERESR